jgi:redox-sensitive bicupin YhaK (pirin superfamily)
MHAAQLWIALPDDKRNMEPKFEHYPELPVVSKDQVEFTVLVGDFLKQPLQFKYIRLWLV